VNATAPVLGAIDCGTNSTRLLVQQAGCAPLVRLMRITRLGQEVDATGALSSAGVERTLRVLAEYRSEMDRLGVTSARLVATSAVRDARNGDRFLAEAEDVVGFRAELLSGDEEGRLAYAGATAGLGPIAGLNVVVDIGGGSTELVVGLPDRLASISLPIGCVRLTERCLPSDPPGTREIDDALDVVRSELDRALRMIPELGALPADSRLIGLAGTVSTLAALEAGLAVYDRAKIHHMVLSRTVVEKWCALLIEEPAARRLDHPGLEPGREDVIVGGILVLQEVMHRLALERCLVSEDDILDGLIASQLS
jgi:exopolyphosphatase / guanosine-5'-triphosphate,3'-diphosphate pyrophosphatase